MQASSSISSPSLQIGIIQFQGALNSEEQVIVNMPIEPLDRLLGNFSLIELDNADLPARSTLVHGKGWCC